MKQFFILALGATLALTPAHAFGESEKGSDHGNGTDHSELVYPGARKNVPVTVETMAGPPKRENRLILRSSNLNYSEAALQSSYYMFVTSTILESYLLPAGGSELKALYKDVVENRGNMDDLSSPQNPFARYTGDYEKHFPIDPVERMMKSNPQTYFDTANVEAALSGLSMSYTLQMNPELSSASCGACAPSDYKSLPAGGISLVMKCSIAGSPDYIVPNSLITIRSLSETKSQTVQIVPPNLLSTLAGWAKNSICQHPDRKEVSTFVRCQLVGATAADETALNQKFKGAYNRYAPEFNLSESIPFINTSMVKSARTFTNPTIERSYFVHDGLFGGTGRTSVYGLRMKVDFSDYNIVVPRATMRRDLAEMVRRSFLAGLDSYSKEKKK